MKRGLTFALPFLAVALGPEPSTQASDHIDGLKTAIDNSADITDLFTFTSPKDPSKLVLVMNVHGIAFSGVAFLQRRRLQVPRSPDRGRRPSPRARTPRRRRPSSAPSPADSLSRRQAAGDVPVLLDRERIDQLRHAQQGLRAGGARAERHQGLRGRALRPLVPRPRADAQVQQQPARRRTPGVNGLQGQNVLSIVVEVDKNRIGAPMLAVTAQTVRK